MTCAAHQLAISRNFLRTEDVDLIRELVAKMRRRKYLEVVDLGAGSGTTTGAVIAERSEGLRITTYDISQDALNWASIFVSNIGAIDLWRGALRDSIVGANDWERDSIDLLLVDTSHEYDNTVDELTVWLPRLRKSGYIWLHDYVGDYPGVTKAVDEAIERGELSLYKQQGLGWAGKRNG